jgi:hypothetical protein
MNMLEPPGIHMNQKRLRPTDCEKRLQVRKPGVRKPRSNGILMPNALAGALLCRLGLGAGGFGTFWGKIFRAIPQNVPKLLRRFAIRI